MTVLHADDVEPVRNDRDGYRWTRRRLAAAAGARLLGASLYELEPGSADFPLHRHLGNEEALFVLEGTGVVRTPGGEHPLRAGSFAAFTVEDDAGHEVRNTGDAPLRFLCVSTMREPDVTLYPERGSLGVFCGAAPGGEGPRRFEGFFDASARVPYW